MLYCSSTCFTETSTSSAVLGQINGGNSSVSVGAGGRVQDLHASGRRLAGRNVKAESFEARSSQHGLEKRGEEEWWG